MLRDDFDICLIFSSLSKHGGHCVFGVCEINVKVNIGIIRAFKKKKEDNVSIIYLAHRYMQK